VSESRRRLTVSTLAHYFGLQCDEYLRLSNNSSTNFKSTETLKDSLTKQRGIDFESNIKSYYSTSILENITDETEFLSYLHTNLNSHNDNVRIGYNIKFRWTYDQNLESNYKPDFLLLKHLPNNENRIEITIADAKSSSQMRIEHCIQVALYALDLRVWIERHQLDQQVFINDFGQIWLPTTTATNEKNQSIPYENKRFPLRKLEERLRYFLKYEFEQILKGNEWMMLARCSFCSFVSHCRRRAIRDDEKSINNLSYFNRSNYLLIKSFFQSTFYPDFDLERLFNGQQSEDHLKLQKLLSIDFQTKTSRVIEALRTHQPQLKQQTSLLIPKFHSNLILIVLFLVPNPSQLHSLTSFAANIYNFSTETWFYSDSITVEYPKPSDIVSLLSQLLRQAGEQPCQILVFDEQEKAMLFEQLTLASDDEHINECLVLLSSSENAILLEHPPDVLQTDRVFASKSQEQVTARQNLIGLPCFISLHTAIRQSFIIPVPGFFTLEDLKSSFQLDLNSNEHFDVLVQLYKIVQTRLCQSNLVQLEACSLPNINPINSSHKHIRRLIFLRQYEMFHSLRTIQQNRFDGNDPPIQIRIIGRDPNDRYYVSWQCQILRGHEIISKNLTENLETATFRTYPYLISKDGYSIQRFSDAIYMDSAIDGLRSAARLDQCGLVNVESQVDGETIFIRTKLCNLRIEINETYFLSERYFDFTTKKAIHALEQTTPLTIQILDDPRQLTKPQAIQNSKYQPSGFDVLNQSQQLACEKVKNERIILIWGPPGTGKTYWSAVTVFQMLMFSKSPLRILITACTHTAIDHLLSSINNLRQVFFNSPLTVFKIDSKSFRTFSSAYEKQQQPLIVGSTVWTLQKLKSSIVFDIIFIDEATQLLTSDAVLAINRLATHNESRLIVAGDPLQLPPVKRCSYPQLPYPIPDLFSSIFHCLLRDQNNGPISLQTEKPFEQISLCPYLSVFDENHRMNDQLSDFTRLLYGKHYRQGGRLRPLLQIRSIVDTDPYLLGSCLDPYNSLYTFLVDSSSSSYTSRSDDLQLESSLIIRLLDELISRVNLSSIFIITPHRMQRSSIKRQLSKKNYPNAIITCDTVERMQGKEAQCVVLCMLYRQRELLGNESDFLYNRQRINVSITRAQQLCILLTSDVLFNQAPFDVFVNENTRNAFNLLNNFVSKSIQINLDEHGNIR